MAEFFSPWQGFGGVSDFGQGMSLLGLWLLKLSLGASISLQQKTATRVGRDLRSTGVAVGYGPRDIRFLCLMRYAIPWCATLDELAEILNLVEKKSAAPAVFASQDADVGSHRLTEFHTHGQFLTMGDKMTLFSAVFLKKVRVL